NYDPPPGGFYLEINDISPIVQDDIDLSDYNLPERVNAFVDAAISQRVSFYAGKYYSNKSYHVHDGNRFPVSVCNHL
ncbi:hypothetical protein LINGRAHAP2_LOCUS23626, partial [Linum grandiflorum]